MQDNLCGKRSTGMERAFDWRRILHLLDDPLHHIRKRMSNNLGALVLRGAKQTPLLQQSLPESLVITWTRKMVWPLTATLSRAHFRAFWLLLSLSTATATSGNDDRSDPSGIALFRQREE
ncbi:hypothetical protein MUK42_19958 [Musa troglodytarum]|uniref:Uncharacterized protein n=1 Tax=Musa troglodytarum TaxID=320322 RepID=A0A9E7FHP7_9LILI|nr:hypothetical protein MUK42_19958 [Musa troglodytarum]